MSVVMIGKLKARDLVLQAAMMPVSRWQGIHLNWYGDVPQKIKERLSACPHVSMHGRVRRELLLDAFQRSDVILFPSRIEGCPMALLEAIVVGLVPITSNGEGAMRWLVASGDGGYGLRSFALAGADAGMPCSLARFSARADAYEGCNPEAVSRSVSELNHGFAAVAPSREPHR